jgi:uncharacterized protein (TIGR00251 family)
VKDKPRIRFKKLHDGKGGAALTVRVTPRARKAEVVGVRADGTVKVRIPAPPVEGKANEALLKFLASVLGIRKRRIEIIAGHKGLDKIISIMDMTAPEVQKRILKHMEAESSKAG